MGAPGRPSGDVSYAGRREAHQLVPEPTLTHRYSLKSSSVNTWWQICPSPPTPTLRRELGPDLPTICGLQEFLLWQTHVPFISPLNSLTILWRGGKGAHTHFYREATTLSTLARCPDSQSCSLPAAGSYVDAADSPCSACHISTLKPHPPPHTSIKSCSSLTSLLDPKGTHYHLWPLPTFNVCPNS